jgi:phosphatidylserine/phosphatidylglycerophosphate/cardiolipin synthase-like enzyme
MKRNSLTPFVLLALCLAVALLLAVPVTSSGDQYNPWLDFNEDGKINIFDVVAVAKAFGTSGTPVKRTALQLEAQSILGVYFSPDGGCKSQLLYWISKANKSIHILIYSFTLDDVGTALVSAFQRGVEVKVLFEKSQISQYSKYPVLRDSGLSVRNDTNSESMHDKVMIFDGLIVLTGSYNYSQNAEERNNENLIVIQSETIAAAYEQEFLRVWNSGT